MSLIWLCFAQAATAYKPEQQQALLAAQNRLFVHMHEVLERREGIMNTLQVGSQVVTLHPGFRVHSIHAAGKVWLVSPRHHCGWCQAVSHVLMPSRVQGAHASVQAFSPEALMVRAWCRPTSPARRRSTRTRRCMSRCGIQALLHVSETPGMWCATRPVLVSGAADHPPGWPEGAWEAPGMWCATRPSSGAADHLPTGLRGHIGQHLYTVHTHPAQACKAADDLKANLEEEYVAVRSFIVDFCHCMDHVQHAKMLVAGCAPPTRHLWCRVS